MREKNWFHLGAALTLGLIFAQNAQAHEFIIKLRGDSAGKLAKDAQLEIKKLSSVKKLYRVKSNFVETREHVYRRLESDPRIAFVERNIRYKLNRLPNDYQEQWSFKNLERLDLDLGVEAAWDVSIGNKTVVVAIIDTGAVLTHEDLRENLWTNTAERAGTVGVDDDANGYVDDVHGWDFQTNSADIDDDDGHGTMCAGIVGAKGNNGIGLTGVNWDVSIMPIRFAYSEFSDWSGSLELAIQGLDYAIQNGAQIILLPWGSSEDSRALQEMLEFAQQKNILIVTSAGNAGEDIDTTPQYPASYENENILVVAALDQSGRLTQNSNWGRRAVDVGAPGVDVMTTSRWDYSEAWPGGTSAAAAYVAGVAALVKAHEPGITFFDLKDRLILTAKQIQSLQGQMVFGGLVSAQYALLNQVAPVDTSDPSGWSAQQQTVETLHPYANGVREEYRVTVPNAKRIAVFFDQFETEKGYDYVTFKDLTGKVLAKWSGDKSKSYSPTANGDTLIMEFTSDSSSTDFGFFATRVSYDP
jgi:thermitase